MNQFKSCTFILPWAVIKIIEEYSIQLNIPRKTAVALLVAEGWKYTNKNPSENEENPLNLSEIANKLTRLESKMDELIHGLDVLPCWQENLVDSERFKSTD